MGSKSNTSSSANTTQQYDQRSIITTDDRDTSYTSNYTADNSVRVSDDSIKLNVSDDRDWYAYDSSDRSTTLTDASDRSVTDLFYDSSNRSVTTVNNTGTDAGAVRLGEMQTQLIGALGEQQTTQAGLWSQFGREGLRGLAQSYEVAGQNTSKAWAHTVDASERVISGLLENSKANTDAAKSLAGAAISAYQPADSKLGDALKWGALAAAAIVGLLILRPAKA